MKTHSEQNQTFSKSWHFTQKSNLSEKLTDLNENKNLQNFHHHYHHHNSNNNNKYSVSKIVQCVLGSDIKWLIAHHSLRNSFIFCFYLFWLLNLVHFLLCHCPTSEFSVLYEGPEKTRKVSMNIKIIKCPVMMEANFTWRWMCISYFLCSANQQSKNASYSCPQVNVIKKFFN